MRFRQGVRRAPAPLGAFFGFFQLGVATGVIHLQADGHRVFAFGAPGLQIVADANEARRSDEQPGFFGDFALGALLEGFAGIQMPAGDRPKGAWEPQRLPNKISPCGLTMITPTPVTTFMLFSVSKVSAQYVILPWR